MTVAGGLRTALRAGARGYADPRGWQVTGALTALAALLRLPNLGWPRAFSFDETYYAKDAFSLLHFGYERAFIDKANELLLAGSTDVFRDTPEFVVHPPLGKWAIALGEAAFGMNPFGWRIVMALLGIAAVALVHRIALRLNTNVHVAALAGLFMAIDGQAIVLSRTALLDQTLMFFVLATFWALVRDRDAYEHTLAMRNYLERVPLRRTLRPWRIAAIVFITCAFATKWSALWFALGFALLALGWDARARRVHEVERSPWLADLGWLVFASLLAVSGYLLSWIGWFRSADAWDRTWTDSATSWLPQSLRAFIYYHQQALHFHVTLTSDHPYKASPFGWLLQLRPTSFFFESYQPGQEPCRADTQCASEVLALGNVVIWWVAAATILALVLNLLARLLHARLALLNFRFDASQSSRVQWSAVSGPLVGVAAGWLPWIYFHERTTFTFYSIAFTPFICILAAEGLALFSTRRVLVPVPRVEAVGEVVEEEEVADGPVPATGESPPAASHVEIDELHLRRFTIAAGIVALAVIFSMFALPIWTGTPIRYSAWQMRMLMKSWI